MICGELKMNLKHGEAVAIGMLMAIKFGIDLGITDSAIYNDVKQVFIPIENKVDLEDVPLEVKKKLDIVFVRDYLDVYYYLFNNEKEEVE